MITINIDTQQRQDLVNLTEDIKRLFPLPVSMRVYVLFIVHIQLVVSL